ncbi:MAG: DUF4981 domain-containing protein, partial [FCB group bacterium]|nr:DUF4981 domain-containing protein [FCB group bacterium]
GALWAGIDVVFTLPSGESAGYGPWGFIDGARREKPEYWHVKKVYSPVRIAEEPLAVPAAGEPVVVRVANRHDFTNLGELRVDWQLIDRGAIVEWGALNGIDVAPRSEGAISVQPKTETIDGKTLGLVFTSPQGFVVDSFMLPIGAPKEAPIPAMDTPGSLEDTADAFVLSGSGVRWHIDKATGQVVRVESGGVAMTLGGPALMMPPLKSDACEPKYRAGIAPLNAMCANARVESVTADGAAVVVRVCYDEAEGEYRLAADSAGRLRLGYRFVVSREFQPRQVGVVLDLPRACDTLEWQRKAQWSVYPLDHIGRARGKARAFPEANGPWALDTTALGSADFRSSKDEILSASLSGTDGAGLRLVSDGHQTARAFVDGEHVRWLVAGYSNAGRGFQTGLDGREITLKPGDVVEDEVVLEILNVEF